MQDETEREESSSSNSQSDHEIVRESGRFVKGVSGNPDGRPKGSKNRVTLLKLMAEEAVRSRKADDMLAVADLVISQAMEGDKDSQKLVWQAIMSKGSIDDRSSAVDKFSINITGVPQVSGSAEVKEEPADEAEFTELEDKENG